MPYALPDIPGADQFGAPAVDSVEQAMAIIAAAQPAPVAQQAQATYDAPPATAPQASGKYSPEVERWRGQITQEFQKQGVPTSLNGVDLIDKALHVVQGESGGNDKIGGDGGAAYGLFQSHYVGTGASSSAQIADAVKLIAKNPAQWTDWGEGATYQGKPFGALGRTPYGTNYPQNQGNFVPSDNPTAQIGTGLGSAVGNIVRQQPQAAMGTPDIDQQAPGTLRQQAIDQGAYDNRTFPVAERLQGQAGDIGAAIGGVIPDFNLPRNVYDKPISYQNADGSTTQQSSSIKVSPREIGRGIGESVVPSTEGQMAAYGLLGATPLGVGGDLQAGAGILQGGKALARDGFKSLLRSGGGSIIEGAGREAARPAWLMGDAELAQHAVRQGIDPRGLSRAEIEARVTAAGGQAARDAAARASGQVNIGGMGSAISGNFYEKVLADLQAGKSMSAAGIPEQVAEAAFKRGGIKTTADLQNIMADAQRVLDSGVKGPELQRSLNDLLSSPAIEAPIRPKPGTPEAVGAEARDAAAAKGARQANIEVSKAEFTSPEEKAGAIQQAVDAHLGGDTDVTLYRGTNPTRNALYGGTEPESGPGKWWTTERKVAEEYAGPNGQVVEAKVKASELADFEHANPIGGPNSGEWTLSPDLQSRAQVIDAGSAPPSGSPPSPPAGGPPAPPTLRGPSGGPPGGTPPTGATPTGPQMEPVAKLTEAIKAAGKATPEQRAMFAAERAQRTAAAAGTLEGQMASGAGGEAGLNAARGTLGGEFTRPSFAVPDFGAEDLKSLYDTIGGTDRLRFYDRLGAQSALRDLVSGRIPQPAQLDSLRRAFPQGGSDLVDAVRTKQGLNIWREISGVMGLPQAMQTIWDVSGTLRQGAVMGWSNPREWATAIREELRAFGSAKAAEQSLSRVEGNAWFTRNDGLGFKDVGGHAYTFGVGEQSTERAGGYAGLNDSMVSRAVQKIPGVQASERSFATLLNEQGMRVYEKYAQSMFDAATAAGRTPDPDDFKALADVINHARGYGSFNVGQVAQGFNALYSGRNAVSRFQVLLDPFTQPGSLLEPSARQLAAKNLAGFITANVALLGMLGETANLTGAWHVEGSPLSSDGGKIRIGNTHIDPWAGFAPLVRLAMREVTGETKTATGETIPVDRKAELIRFFRNKESPIVGLVTDIFSGKDAIGQKPSATQYLSSMGQLVKDATGSQAAGVAADMLTPFIVNDVADAMRLSGNGAAAVAGPASALGFGSNSYVPGVNEQKDQAARSQFGKPYSQLLPSQQEQINQSASIQTATQSRPQTEYQRVKEAAYAPIQQQQDQAEAAFAQGDLTKPLPDRWAELQQQRIGARATLEAAFTKTFSKFQKDQFDKALDGYYGTQVKNSDGTPNFDASTVAQQKFLAGQSPEVQTWLNDFLDTNKTNQSPLRQKYIAYLDAKDKAGYFAPSADGQKLDAANPELDVQGWYFRGGVKPGPDGVDHTPTLNSALAVDQALSMNLPNRTVKFSGLGRNIAESDGAKAFWNDNKTVVSNYFNDDLMLGGGRGVMAAAKLVNSTKDTEYRKPLDQMDSNHRSQVLSNVRGKLRKDHPDIEAALLVMGQSKDGKANTLAAYNLAGQMVQKYKLGRAGDGYTITKAKDVR